MTGVRTERFRGMHPAARDALVVLGQRIRMARHRKGWTAAQLAASARVSKPTVLAVEAGKPTVAAGTVFNIAVLAGVKLFSADDHELLRLRRQGEDTLALLPSRVDPKPVVIDDDF